jgi:hypothetical protein
VQFLRALSSGSDVEPGRSGFDELLFGGQVQSKPILAPYGAAVHAGKVYVCDLELGGIVVIDLAAQSVDELQLAGRAKLQKPTNLAFAPDGTLYVADLGRRQIVVLAADGRYLAEFGPFGDESRAVDVDLRGAELFVTDTGARCVRVLSLPDGVEQRRFGDGRLRAPTNLALDGEGNAFVVDTVDCRVSVFDASGTFQRTLGEPGSAIGCFARPKGIACLDEQVFVIDSAFENCQVFAAAGAPLMFFGGPGTTPGSCYLPAGIWAGKEGLELFADELDPDFDARALLIVTNFYGDQRVSFYALGTSRRFQYAP